MVVVFLYDGSFEGLLTAIYEAYYTEKPDRIVPEWRYEPRFTDRPRTIETQIEKSDKVYHSIINKISTSALQHVYKAYLSDDPQAADLIYAYLRLGYRMGPQIDQDLVNPVVLPVHRLCRKVDSETHRLLGLLRFQLINQELYYGAIEPDHHVISLMAPHFTERMGDQSWMIHDVKRGIAAVCQNRRWVLTAVQGIYTGELPEEELVFQNLWKTYFKHIAIPERINPKLQKRCMPTRYWKHLIEK